MITWDEKCAYAAGLLDGEGCINIYKDFSSHYHVKVTITNTNEDVMRWLHANFEGGACLGKRSFNDGIRKDIYKWELNGVEAKEFLESVYKYLIIKKLQAQNVFFYYARQWNQSGEDFYLKNRELNKKGKI